ncbi:hypothetical protein IAT40_005924 [Kwoniella sp. CBS 6097]
MRTNTEHEHPLKAEEHSGHPDNEGSLKMMGWDQVEDCLVHEGTECWTHPSVVQLQLTGSMPPHTTHFHRPMHIPLIYGSGLLLSAQDTTRKEANTCHRQDRWYPIRAQTQPGSCNLPSGRHMYRIPAEERKSTGVVHSEWDPDGLAEPPGPSEEQPHKGRKKRSNTDEDECDVGEESISLSSSSRERRKRRMVLTQTPSADSMATSAFIERNETETSMSSSRSKQPFSPPCHRLTTPSEHLLPDCEETNHVRYPGRRSQNITQSQEIATSQKRVEQHMVNRPDQVSGEPLFPLPPSTNDTTSSDLERKTAVIEAKDAEIKSAREELRQAQVEKDELLRVFTKESADELKRKIDSLETEHMTLIHDNVQATSMIAELNAQLEQSRTLFKQCEEARLETISRAKEMETECEKRKDDLASLRATYIQTSQTLGEKIKAVKQKDAVIISLNEQKQQLELRTEKEEYDDDDTTRVRRADQQQLSQELSSAIATIESLEKEQVKWVEEMSCLKEEMERYKAESIRLAEEGNKAAMKIGNLVLEKEDLAGEVKRVKTGMV